jgi:hypothetical protein
VFKPRVCINKIKDWQRILETVGAFLFTLRIYLRIASSHTKMKQELLAEFPDELLAYARPCVVGPLTPLGGFVTPAFRSADAIPSFFDITSAQMSYCGVTVSA